MGSAGDRLSSGAMSRYPAHVRRFFLLFAMLAGAAPLAAKDSLGVFDDWGACSDPGVPRCYAIAAADKAAGTYQAYADVGTWPRQGVGVQVHFRL